MMKSGKSISNCKDIALDPILKPEFNKDIGLHFLTYFADTSFYSLAIKSIYHQYSYQLAIEKNDEIVQQLIVWFYWFKLDQVSLAS